MTETTALFKMILTDKWDEVTLKLVGQIAIAFAQLEQVLWISPKRIKKLEFSYWDAIAGKVTIPTRCDQISAAYAIRQMSQGKEAELEKLLEEIKTVNEARNSIMHARWGCKKHDSEVVSRHRIWKGKDRGIFHEELRRILTDIRRLRDQLGRYRW